MHAVNKDKKTPLHLAGQENTTAQIIRLLYKYKACGNRQDTHGFTPLHLAGQKNKNPEVIDALIHGGATVDSKNFHGLTPLHVASIWNQQPAIIDALVQNNADIHAFSNTGATPLHGAAQYNRNPAIIKALVRNGAYINATMCKEKLVLDDYTETTMMGVAKKRYMRALFERLLSRTYTPLKLTKHNRNWNATRILEELGSK